MHKSYPQIKKDADAEYFMVLTKAQRNILEKIAKKHNLLLVVLYGSFAQGQETEESDVDVAILKKGNIDIEDYYEDYGKLITSFEGVFPNRRIDLVPLRGRDPLFFHQIMNKSVLLYGDPALYRRFKVNALMRYIDAKPLFKTEEILVYKKQKYLMQSMK